MRWYCILFVCSFRLASVPAGLAAAAYPDVFAAQATYGQLRTVPFSIHAIPHLFEIEQIVLSQQRRKACGPDAITAELLQLSSKTSARQLLPILAKATFGLREPVAFRGGHLFCLAKTACVNFACSSFRSILLASIPGKVFHKTIHARLTGPLARFASPLQAGSQPGISTDGISTTTRLFQELELGRARYPAVIYFDLRAAYYRMLRQILVPIQEPEEGFMRLLHSLQLPDDALRELVGHLQSLSVLELAEVTPHVIATVSDLFRGTWFRLDRDAALIITARGSRPGDPLADILFAFTLSAYLKSCEGALQSKNLGVDLPALRSSPLHDSLPCKRGLGFASWADDLARLVSDCSYSALLSKVTRTMRVCAEHASAVSMVFVFSKQKTAVLLPPLTGRHRGRRAIEADVVCPEWLVVSNAVTGETHRLEVVHAYRHLGTIVTADALPSVEIAHRRSLALGVTRALASKLFSNPRFPPPAGRSCSRLPSPSLFLVRPH